MSKISLTSRLPDTIETKRLLLRAPDMSDAPALQELANNKTIHKFLARLPYPYTREHAVDFITNLARAENEHAYAITLDNALVGVMGLHLADADIPELGYWLGQPFWGNGYATEAALGVLQAAAAAGFSAVTARSITSNRGSISVLLKSGFAIVAENVDDCGQHHNVPLTHFKWEKDK